MRGYISGSAWKEYKSHRQSLRHPAAAGSEGSDKLPEPIFTPSTKPVRTRREYFFRGSVRLVGAELAAQLRDITLKIYTQAADYARTKGIIIADTKFEFGITAPGLRWRTKCLRRIPRASGRPTIPAGQGAGFL